MMRGTPGPVRVLCVTPSGLAGRGGIDRLYYYLRRAGLAALMPGVSMRFAAARGGAPGALWPLAFPLRLAGIALELLRVRPEVVHVNFAMRGSGLRKMAVLVLARAAGARTVVHLHDSLPIASLERGGFEGRLFRAICARADRVIALGRPSAEAMAGNGVPADKIRVVLNGIPDFADGLPLPKPERDVVTLLLAGRVGAHKGAGILLDALALLARRGIGGWRCVVAGDGEVEAYRTRAAALGLADRVVFTGWLDADATHALMREADIVVLPSRAEALPLSLAEGACAGAALVATPVGNVAEIVQDPDNGRLVPREPEAWAEALAGLLGRRDELARMQLASRRRYREALTIERFAAHLGAIYAELAEEGRGRSPSAAGPRGAASPDQIRA